MDARPTNDDLTSGPLPLRLRALRSEAGLSQAALGEAIGLSKDIASTRINRYEQGVHAPDIKTAKALARKLGVPLAYLYAEDERLAVVIRAFGKMSEEERDRLLELMESLLS